MWNRKNTDNNIEPKTPAGSVPAQSKSSDASPVIAQPMTVVGPPSRAASIGKGTNIKGDLVAKEDLFIDGHVDGSIQLTAHTLTVGSNATIVAGIQARTVIVLGVIQGNIDASERVEIRREAKVQGDIRTGRIQIEEGAFFLGKVDTIRPAEGAKPKEGNKGEKPPSSARVEGGSGPN